MSFWCCCAAPPSDSRSESSSLSVPPDIRIPCFPCSSDRVATLFSPTAMISPVSYNGVAWADAVGLLEGLELEFDIDDELRYEPPICQVTYFRDFSGDPTEPTDFIDVRVEWRIEWWQQERPYDPPLWPETDIVVLFRRYTEESGLTRPVSSVQFALRPVWLRWFYDYSCDGTDLKASTTQTLVNIFNSAEKLEVSLTNDV